MGYPKARTDGRGHFWIGSFWTQRRLREFETFARIANKPKAVRCVDRLWRERRFGDFWRGISMLSGRVEQGFTGCNRPAESIHDMVNCLRFFRQDSVAVSRVDRYDDRRVDPSFLTIRFPCHPEHGLLADSGTLMDSLFQQPRFTVVAIMSDFALRSASFCVERQVVAGILSAGPEGTRDADFSCPGDHRRLGRQRLHSSPVVVAWRIAKAGDDIAHAWTTSIAQTNFSPPERDSSASPASRA